MRTEAPYRTRFAPSPTGLLHLGHAFSALSAQARAKAAGGTLLLRIEDIDRPRCRPEFEDAIFEDLRWLGLQWPEPVMRQSGRMGHYRAALNRLADLGVVYPCRCSRAEIRDALSAPQEGMANMTVYPGTCRGRSMRDAGPDDAIRLDMARALSALGGGPLGFEELGPVRPGHHRCDGDTLRGNTGDAALSRRDIGTSYHIAAVVDDAAQGITEVVRGIDLFEVTPLHVLLQALLDLPRPSYWHHHLIRDENGRRLAKRDDAKSIRAYRMAGETPAEVMRRIGVTSPV